MKCRICNKELSIYNESGGCYYHNEEPDSIVSIFKVVISGGICGNHTRYTQMMENGSWSEY